MKSILLETTAQSHTSFYAQERPVVELMGQCERIWGDYQLLNETSMRLLDYEDSGLFTMESSGDTPTALVEALVHTS